MPFVDTNLLLYRVSLDPKERSKQEIATEILDRDDLFLSTKVLQEFYVQATRPSRPDALTHDEAVSLIESWKRFPVIEGSITLLDAALASKERWQISYWDAAIIEAARIAGCKTVFSEDLNDGQDFDGVKVINPFKSA
jgi:predicted nucleic acid-binding protein